MTGLQKLWVLAVLAGFGWLAAGVMLGATPGRGTEGFGALADLIDAKAEAHGRVFTGIAVFLIGCVVAALGLTRGEGSGHDGGGGGDGWFGGDCGGGDGGGD